MKRFNKFYFLPVVLLLFVISFFIIKSIKNKQLVEMEFGPGLACVYVFSTDYKVEELAAIELSGGDHKLIKSWNQQIGMFEKVKDGQYFIYDYMCNKDFLNSHFLINLPKEEYDQYDKINDYKMDLVYWDTYKNFYYCEVDKIGVSNYETEKIKVMINDGSIYNKCKKLK